MARPSEQMMIRSGDFVSVCTFALHFYPPHPHSELSTVVLEIVVDTDRSWSPRLVLAGDTDRSMVRFLGNLGSPRGDWGLARHRGCVRRAAGSKETLKR